MGTMMAPRAHARGSPESWSTNRHQRRPPGWARRSLPCTPRRFTFAELTWDLSWTTRDGTDRTLTWPSGLPVGERRLGGPRASPGELNHPRERMLASRPDGPALCRQRGPVAGCAVPAQVKLPRPVHAVCRSDRGSAPITCLAHLLPPVVWLRDRKLAVVVSPQQCGEHGRFADLGLAGPGEQCQPPVLSSPRKCDSASACLGSCSSTR